MKRTLYYRITMILLWAMMSCAACYAGSYRSLTTTDGLSDMLVNVIYKDSTGFVWFGTETALDRFDGNSIKTFRFPDDSQGAQRVNTLAETRSDRMYVGNHSGLFSIDAAGQQLERVCAESITFPVNALVHEGCGILWVGTRQGLYRYDTNRNSLRPVLLGSDILSQDNEVTGLCIDPDGKGVWITSLFALHRYDLASGTVTDYRSPEQGPIMRMTGIGDTLYLGTRGSGVVPFVKSQAEFLPGIDLGNNIITSLRHDNDNNLVAVTDGEGVFTYDPVRRLTLRHIKTSNSDLRSNSIYATYTDNEGLDWIGYYQGGVDYTPRRGDLFDTYCYPGLVDTRDCEVRALAIDGRRKVIGTRDGLYYVDESTGRTAAFRRPQIRSNLIFCITPWGGRYYIGTYGGGVYVFDPNTLNISEMQLGGVGSAHGKISCFDIKTGPDGSLWLGTSVGLLRYGDGGVQAHYDSANSRLPEGNVYDIFFDSAGRGWISTENGMAIWDGSTLRTDRFPAGFINRRKIRDVFEDRDHNLYFAPDRGDVFKSNFELTRFGSIDLGMRGLSVMTTFIIEDNDGWLWLGTDKGLIRYDKKGKFRLYNNASGLPDIVFTLCPPHKDANGDIWMGNNKGLLRLDFEGMRSAESRLHRRLSVTDMTSNGASIYTRITTDRNGRLLRLASDESDLEVSFSNFEYISPEYCSVEYMLEGHDDGWRMTDGKRPIHYFGLPSGKYVLRVRRVGDPSTETAMRVHKSIGIGWITTYIIIGLVILAGGVVMFRQMRSMRRRHEEQLLAMAESKADAATVATPDGTESVVKERYRTTRLSDEECKRLTRTLDNVMRTSRPYINPDLKISELAQMAGTTAHALSYLFNQYMNRSYYDYVNGYRVEEFKHLVKDTDTSRYTLTAMAQKCGFSSRASFFRHFKAITGITPSEYLKSMS